MAGDVPYMTLCFLVGILNIAPFCWQLEHRNSGAVCLGFWVIVLNIANFINAVVWRDNVDNSAPILCDILSKISLAAPVGSICSNICIARFLAEIVSPSHASLSRTDRRRREIFDYTFSFGFPIIIATAQVLVEPSRYGILRTTGCSPTWVLTWATYLCYFVWLPLLSFIGCFVSSYVIYRLARHRFKFSRLVSASNSALTASRFIRLTALGIASIAFNTALSITAILGAKAGAGPYIDYSWAYIHSDFGTPIVISSTTQASFGNWGSVIAGINVLIFFGFGTEALSYYRKLAGVLGMQRVFHLGMGKPSNRLTKIVPSVSHIALGALGPTDLEKTPYDTEFDNLEKADGVYDGPFSVPNYAALQLSTLPVRVEREEHIV